MIECWKKNGYFYGDLEEMYLENMHLNPDRDMLAKELGNSLGDNRYDYMHHVISSQIRVGKRFRMVLHTDSWSSLQSDSFPQSLRCRTN